MKRLLLKIILFVGIGFCTFMVIAMVFGVYTMLWDIFVPSKYKIRHYSSYEAVSWWDGGYPQGATNIWNYEDLRRRTFECEISYEDFLAYVEFIKSGEYNKDDEWQKSKLPVRIARYSRELGEEDRFARLKDNTSSKTYHICHNGESYYKVVGSMVWTQILYDFDEGKMYYHRGGVSDGFLYANLTSEDDEIGTNEDDGQEINDSI